MRAFVRIFVGLSVGASGVAACAWSSGATDSDGGFASPDGGDVQDGAKIHTDAGDSKDATAKDASSLDGDAEGGNSSDGGLEAASNVLATGTNLGPVFVDDAYVYWAEVGEVPEAGAVLPSYIKRVAKGVMSPTPQVLAAAPALPASDCVAGIAAFGIDDINIYYVSVTPGSPGDGRGTVYSVPKAGGLPTLMTGPLSVYTGGTRGGGYGLSLSGNTLPMTVTSDALSWHGRIYNTTTPTEGTGQPYFVRLAKLVDAGSPTEVPVSGAGILGYTQVGDDYFVGQADWTISHVKLDGGAQLLASGQALPNALTGDDSGVYWAAAGVGIIASVPTSYDAGAALGDAAVPISVIVDGGALSVTQMQLNTSLLVWTDGTSIWKAPRTGGVPTKIASDTSTILFLAVDDISVYWTNESELRWAAL